MIYPFFLTSSQYTISISKIWCTLLHIIGLNTPNEGSDHTYLHMIGRNTPEQWTTDHGLITPTHDSSDNMYLHLIGLNTPTVPTHDWSEHIYLLMIDWTHLISHNWSKHNHLPGLGIRSFAHSLILLKSNILTKKSKILISMFYIGFFVYKNEQFVHSLIFGERCERIPQVAHQKWAMWANRSGCSPKLVMWVNRSGCSPKMSKWANHSFLWANGSFAHFFAKNELPAQ